MTHLKKDAELHELHAYKKGGNLTESDSIKEDWFTTTEADWKPLQIEWTTEIGRIGRL